MVYDFIQFKAKPDKVDDIKALYQEHFQELREMDAPMARYEVYTSKMDETQFFTIKVFETRADERAHHTHPELGAFVKKLGDLCDVTAQFHEVELYAAK